MLTINAVESYDINYKGDESSNQSKQC